MQRTLYATILPAILMAACIDDDLDEPAAPSEETVEDDSIAVEPDTIESLATPENPDAGTKKTHPYQVSWTFKSPPLHKCVIFTATGKIRYISRPFRAGRVSVWQWVNPTVIDPTLTASVHDYANGSCIGPATLTKLFMRQSWAGHECTFNPSIGLSAARGPWGVSISGWPSCNDRPQAHHGTTYPTTDPVYVQHNTGSPFSYGNFSAPIVVDPTPKGPCYGVYVNAEAWVRNISDTYTVQRTAARKVCLPQ